MAARRMSSTRLERSRCSVEPEGANSQQDRHHEIVADHRRERDRLDDHHAGGRRQASDEHEERQAFRLLRHRYRQHERVRVHGARREVQHSAEGDRKHEDVDRQHVERKHPRGASQVPLVRVLDHRHLELPGQEDDGEHREHREPDPARVAPRSPSQGRHQRLEVGPGGRLREDVAQTVVHEERHVDADGEERDQLHDGLEGDRGDHALVALGRVELARAEGDGEERHEERDIEGRVLHHDHRPHLGGIAISG